MMKFLPMFMVPWFVLMVENGLSRLFQTTFYEDVQKLFLARIYTYLARLALVIIQFSSSNHESSSICFIIQSIICQLLYPGSLPNNSTVPKNSAQYRATKINVPKAKNYERAWEIMLEFTNHALPQFIPQKMIDFN